WMPAIDRVLDAKKGTSQFVRFVDQFRVQSRFPELLTMAQTKPDQQLGIDAIRVLLGHNQAELLSTALRATSGSTAMATATALSGSGEAAAAQLLLPLVKDLSVSADTRREAVKGAARTREGIDEIVRIARQKRPEDETLVPALSAALAGSSFDDVRQLASTIYPPLPGKNDQPLPVLSDLAKQKGNSSSGGKLFATIAKCNTCHVVNGEGKDVGPNLSEIGAKLSRQALFESIIFPSAGISHNYESWTLALHDGTTATGIIISEDGDKITLKGNDAIVRSINKKEVDERKKNSISLMPADLTKLVTREELVDVVEYLTTLKQARK
ncbi:MAG: c-type cytochrome, partial [Planctomycetes bacterium]|nr:c-type cytochrome [Planctomycetota bacterium]